MSTSLTCHTALWTGPADLHPEIHNRLLFHSIAMQPGYVQQKAGHEIDANARGSRRFTSADTRLR